MGAVATIGIDDDFTAGETGVAVGTAYDEFSGGVDQQAYVGADEVANVLGQSGDNAWQEDVADVVGDGGVHFFVTFLAREVAVGGVDEIVVLCRYHDGVHTHRDTGWSVLDGHLALCVGAQVGHLTAFVTDCGEFLEDGMAQCQRQRHVDGRLVGGVAEHHALVAGALAVLGFSHYAAVDVGTLFVNGEEHAARVAVEAEARTVVADGACNLAGGLHDVDIGVAEDLAGNNNLAGGDEGLACDFGVGVTGEEFVEDGVADLVGHFVGMAFGD